MIPTVSLSTTSRRAASSSNTSSSSNNSQLTACDVISVRFRRRSRSARTNTFKSKGLSSSSSTASHPLVLLFIALASFFFANKIAPVHSLSAAKSQWIDNSLQYYSRITRGAEHVQESPTYLKSAMENYFALEKVRENKPHHAESIYRRLMDEYNPCASAVVEDCDFSNLAVPTLLLGLLLQREDRFDDARIVFEGFSHAMEKEGGDHKCSCAARVLQAHALFEMKQGNSVKSAELILRAVRMDHNLRPVLRWKLFRDAIVEYRTVQLARYQQTQAMMLATP